MEGTDHSRRPAVTALLSRWRAGDEPALQQLIELVYGELRQVARRRLAAERAGHSLTPTELVHEAYARLVEADVPFQDRVHFFAVAASTMRRILVDRARSRMAQKRGGDARPVTYDDVVGLGDGAPAVQASDPEALLALHAAIDKLAARDERKAKLLELHFFAGLTYEESAEALGISAATVDRDMRFARAWLRKELT